jgi:RNA polymerase sigma factor (sigma-70 family)
MRVGVHVPGEPDFKTRLAAARAGAEWAWADVYREYSPAVLRYLRGHRAQEPEDLLGEVFVQLVRNIPSFEGTERDFRSWVFTVAHNRLADEWRRSRRSRVEYVSDEELSDACGSADAETDISQRMGDAQAMAILHRLTPDQRDVLFLRMFARLTVDEVAGVVGKRAGAVKALQSRALATIRREMSKGAVSF